MIVSKIVGTVARLAEVLTDPFFKNISVKDINKICVVLLQGIGNTVLFLPTLDNLIRTYPNAKISIIGKKENIELLGGYVGLEFIEYPTKQSITNKIRFLLGIRRKKFDVVIYGCPNLYFGASLLCFILGRMRLLHNYKVGSYENCSFLNSFRLPYRYEINDCYQNLDLLRFLGIESPQKIAPRLPIPEHVENLVVKNMPKAEMIVGMHVGSFGIIKKWPAAHFAKLADMIVKNYNCTIILIGGNHDKNDIDEFLRQVNVPITNYAYRPLLETSAIIKHCDLFISVDSGPMHIACAVGTKTIAIYGPSTGYMRTQPLGDVRIVTLHPKCAPCTTTNEECPIKTHFCLLTLTPEKVMAELKDYIHLP